MTAQLRDCVKRRGFMIHLFCCDGGIKLIIVYSSPPQTVFHPAELNSSTLHEQAGKSLFEDARLGFWGVWNNV